MVGSRSPPRLHYLLESLLQYCFPGYWLLLEGGFYPALDISKDALLTFKNVQCLHIIHEQNLWSCTSVVIVAARFVHTKLTGDDFPFWFAVLLKVGHEFVLMQHKIEKISTMKIVPFKCLHLLNCTHHLSKDSGSAEFKFPGLTVHSQCSVKSGLRPVHSQLSKGQKWGCLWYAVSQKDPLPENNV